ncbi:MAG: L,D-transpeptidase family protein [Verrucomicrobiales bacterium]|nr:L,D-transpeptidase family protein [Verrucomicrobiales bacterium]
MAEDWFPQCRQVVLVSSDSWGAATGELSMWEKRGEQWKEVRSGIPVSLGRKGMGLGLGLHRDRKEVPQKNEGDRRAPAGIFPLEFGFGRKASPANPGGLAYRRAGASDYWVDDPDSQFYNQWVDTSDRRIRKDWNSAETLARSDGLYDLVVVVGHNRAETVPGRGSAIFLHRWKARGVPTIGCTALDPEELLNLWKWLRRKDAPLLVQGPVEYLKTLSLPHALQSSP